MPKPAHCFGALALSAALTVVFTGTATAQDSVQQKSPTGLAASLMAQFYDVPVDTIRTEIKSSGPRTAVVMAKDSAGHACTFDTAEAPPQAAAPFGWVVASTKCND